MAEYDKDVLHFLLQQVQWCKEQDKILADIEETLYLMRALAEYRSAHVLPEQEVQRLNDEMLFLEAEVKCLQLDLDNEITH